MKSVKAIVYDSPLKIKYIRRSADEITFPRGIFFRPESDQLAGDALHADLQDDERDAGLDPMTKRFRSHVGTIGQKHRSDWRVYYPGLYTGRLDWDLFGEKQIQVFEFKWAVNGLPDAPRDVDVKQVALYAYALKNAFPQHELWLRLAYFFGGRGKERAGIRIFNFCHPKQLLGIANCMLSGF